MSALVVFHSTGIELRFEEILRGKIRKINTNIKGEIIHLFNRMRCSTPERNQVQLEKLLRQKLS